MSDGRTTYSRALAAFDRAGILASLSDEITIRVAAHDQPLRGKDTPASCSESSRTVRIVLDTTGFGLLVAACIKR